VFYNERGGPFRCCRRWFYIGLRAGECPTLDRRAVQFSRQYIALDLRTSPADGPTTRAVASHDRRPCNCVGRSLFLPRRPRRMAVQGPGPSARRPAPIGVPTATAITRTMAVVAAANERAKIAIVRKWIQSRPSLLLVVTFGSFS